MYLQRDSLQRSTKVNLIQEADCCLEVCELRKITQLRRLKVSRTMTETSLTVITALVVALTQQLYELLLLF